MTDIRRHPSAPGRHLPNTDYFELDSSHVGGRFAIWVTRPVGYDAERRHQLPGGLCHRRKRRGGHAGASGGAHGVRADYGLPAVPADHRRLSARPGGGLADAAHQGPGSGGEPAPQSIIDSVAADAETAGWTQEEQDEYIRSIQSGRAAEFLAFFEDELRPVIEERYRVLEGATGLFGYSYGGLFTLYALMRQSPMFHRYGAGSPGVLHPGSQIFLLEQQLAGSGAGFDDVQLHLTLNELEITGRSHGYRDLGIQFARLIDKLYLSDHDGLDFSARILPNDTHMTGYTSSYLSYIRSCYGAPFPRRGGSADLAAQVHGEQVHVVGRQLGEAEVLVEPGRALIGEP